MFGMLTGPYIGIPASRVSVFKLGRIFTLFPRLTQLRLAKSTAITVEFDSAHFRGLRSRIVMGTIAQQSEDAKNQ